MSEKRLLILDDDPLIGQMIVTIATRDRIVAQYTQDPGRFFELVETWSPTHIALDLVMPQMDGVEVMVQLARRRCDARIIISSGVGSRVLDAAGRSAAEHGLDIAGVLPKPFSATALRELLAREAPAADAACAAATGADESIAFSPEAADLRRALDNGELVVHYEPKVACASGDLAGFEALVRWHHPARGLVLPAAFIEVAEAHGLIDALTDRVLDLALPWFARGFPSAGAVRCASPGAGPVSLSVNISARSLHDMHLADRILSRCIATGLEPSRLIFELTETSTMEDPVASLDLLTRLRMKGFQLSIDDFGTGFSSMLQLVRLPFSELKVDRSFVMTAARSQESRTVIKSIVDLAHSLGLRCTAEGVIDAAALDYLHGIGCDLAQGYLIGRPMPGEQVMRWVEARPSRS